MRDWTRGNGQKMEYRKLCKNMRKNVFALSLAEHWNKLPVSVTGSPLEIVKTYLDFFPVQLTLGNLP